MRNSILQFLVFLFSLNAMAEPNDVDAKLTSAREYTKSEIVVAIAGEDGAKPPGELAYASSLYPCAEQEIFVTHHRSESGFDRLRFWKRNQNTYSLMREFNGGADQEGVEKHLDDFHKFRIGDEQFVHVSLNNSGTCACHEDTILHLTCHSNRAALDDVQLELPSEWYKPKLNKGEGVWKGEVYDFSDDKLNFEFGIWKEDDANCCPTAGRVEGSFKLLPEGSSPGQFKLVIDQATRLPARN